MIAFDTNVLVRHLVEDDPGQTAIARRMIEEALLSGQSILIPRTVLVETIWVLRSAHGATRSKLVALVAALLEAPPFVVADQELVRSALGRWADGRGDLADYIILEEAERAGCTLATFDRGLTGDRGARVL